jgi:heat shock protein HtpX
VVRRDVLVQVAATSIDPLDAAATTIRRGGRVDPPRGEAPRSSWLGHTPAVARPADGSFTRFQRAEQRLADGLARRQLASVSSRARISARPSIWSRVLMWLLVAPVHVVLLVSVLGGGYLVVRGPGVPLRILGVLLLLVGYATAPRPGKVPRHSASLTSTEAPHLFALVSEVAAVCGTRAPSRVLVTGDFNAFAARIGWRRIPFLGIGAPLWVAAPPQSRVALLGHELGHFAHGDLADSWWVWSAQTSLLQWADIVRGPRHVLYGDSAFVVKYALLPFQALVLGYLWVISKLNGPASQRREYLADVDAANAAGTAGAVRMLEVLLVEPAVTTAMTRAAVSPLRPDMWELVRGDVAGLGEDDFRRRRGGLEAARSRIDDSHPATLLRLQLLESLPPSVARTALDTGRAQAIDAELSPALSAAASHAAEHIRYRR